jgi:hypothetical protein
VWTKVERSSRPHAVGNRCDGSKDPDVRGSFCIFVRQKERRKENFVAITGKADLAINWLETQAEMIIIWLMKNCVRN